MKDKLATTASTGVAARRKNDGAKSNGCGWRQGNSSMNIQPHFEELFELLEKHGAQAWKT
jgi:hypothetical protein